MCTMCTMYTDMFDYIYIYVYLYMYRYIYTYMDYFKILNYLASLLPIGEVYFVILLLLCINMLIIFRKMVG